MNIFNRLSVDVEYQRCIKLFTQYQQTQPIDASKCVSRIIFIQKMYMRWIKIKSNGNNIEIMGIYDIILNELSDKYSIAEFLRDYKYLVYDNRNSLPFHDEENEQESIECNINECFIHNRINRHRGEISTHSDLRSVLFFADEQNDESLSKSIFIQDILDGLHQFIYHTLRAEIEPFINIKYYQNDDVETEDQRLDIEASLLDKGIKAFTQFVKEQKLSSNRFADISLTKTNKFMTLSIEDTARQFKFFLHRQRR